MNFEKEKIDNDIHSRFFLTFLLYKSDYFKYKKSYDLSE